MSQRNVTANSQTTKIGIHNLNCSSTFLNKLLVNHYSLLSLFVTVKLKLEAEDRSDHAGQAYVYNIQIIYSSNMHSSINLFLIKKFLAKNISL